jgi:hypothetical protein
MMRTDQIERICDVSLIIPPTTLRLAVRPTSDVIAAQIIASAALSRHRKKQKPQQALPPWGFQSPSRLWVERLGCRGG